MPLVQRCLQWSSLVPALPHGPLNGVWPCGCPARAVATGIGATHAWAPVWLAIVRISCLLAIYSFVSGWCWIKPSMSSKSDRDIPVCSCLIVLHGVEQPLQQAQTSKPWRGMLLTSSRQHRQSLHSVCLIFGGGNEATRSGYSFNRQDYCRKAL